MVLSVCLTILSDVTHIFQHFSQFQFAEIRNYNLNNYVFLLFWGETISRQPLPIVFCSTVNRAPTHITSQGSLFSFKKKKKKGKTLKGPLVQIPVQREQIAPVVHVQTEKQTGQSSDWEAPCIQLHKLKRKMERKKKSGVLSFAPPRLWAMQWECRREASYQQGKRVEKKRNGKRTGHSSAELSSSSDTPEQRFQLFFSNQSNVVVVSLYFSFLVLYAGLSSFGEGGHHGPEQLVGVVFHALALGLQVQQLPYPLHGQIVLVVKQRGKSVLQHVRRVS